MRHVRINTEEEKKKRGGCLKCLSTIADFNFSLLSLFSAQHNSECRVCERDELRRRCGEVWFVGGGDVHCRLHSGSPSLLAPHRTHQPFFFFLHSLRL